MTKIPKELQQIVYQSVKILGQAIKEVYGKKAFTEIEKLRHQMKKIRNKDDVTVHRHLEKLYGQLKKSSTTELHQKAKAYSLMLELINTCEASYRSYRLELVKSSPDRPKHLPRGMIFVFTSHPTEARSSAFLFVMDKIESLILSALKTNIKTVEDEILYFLTKALQIDLANNKKPAVIDEAEQIIHTVLNKSILEEQISLKKQGINVCFKTWTGGDKDGHPLVGPETMMQSLSLSRNKLIDYIQTILDDFILEAITLKQTRLKTSLLSLRAKLETCRKINLRDGQKIKTIINSLNRIKRHSPFIQNMRDLINLYPALVMPLEIREDHDLIHSALKNPKMTIAKMLMKLKSISRGLNPRHYVNSFVISMCKSSLDLLAAARLTKKHLGQLGIPIVPLFEEEVGLTNYLAILKEAFLAFPFQKIHKDKWNGLFEVMLGYSDSTKENGVLPGRLMVEKAANELETYLSQTAGLVPVFFHGSGGSINRGGGTVKEQLSWLPKSSLDLYKATIQGEMVQRNFHQSLIMRSQIDKIIVEYNCYKKRRTGHSKALFNFAKNIQSKYKALIEDVDFQNLVQVATPYDFLNLLKIGSRPVKRTGKGQFSLRAIPWTLCWTQTRLFLPIWWGIGSSWSELDAEAKKEILKDYNSSPMLQTFIKNLGFTLAKIELGVWKFHLEHTSLSKNDKKKWNAIIEKELFESFLFFKDLAKTTQLLWFRPWLAESIYFRSSMIHPLNVIQKIALERKDHVLLRETVTGISCGMLTTG